MINGCWPSLIAALSMTTSGSLVNSGWPVMKNLSSILSVRARFISLETVRSLHRVKPSIAAKSPKCPKQNEETAFSSELSIIWYSS